MSLQMGAEMRSSDVEYWGIANSRELLKSTSMLAQTAF